VPVVAEALGLGEVVGAVEDDWVGIGLGGPSSEQPATASARKDSTATVPTVVVRDLRMTTSSGCDGTGVRAAPRCGSPALARTRPTGGGRPVERRAAYSAP
jgi:hypothetical protein